MFICNTDWFKINSTKKSN